MKAAAAWVMPENGLFLEPPGAVRAAKKKRGPPEEDRPRAPDAGSWARSFAPRDRDELAVNRKKVQEVETWLQSNIGEGAKGAPLLLLCGPAGAGKTATVLCLAGQLGLTLHEWASPAKTEWAPRMQGPVEAFEAFLFQCSRYRPLVPNRFGRSGCPLILVEDLPNAFLRDADAFHQVLRRYRRTCRTPLVFVVSESSDNLEYRLFPRELVAELGVSKIAFNPVAPTSMSKVLAAVVDKATARYKVSHLPTPDDLEQIAASSAGDVRNAINALQFFCSAEQGPAGPMQPTAAKKPRRRRKPREGPQGEAGGAAPAGSRDCSLQLFHSLGKMLYCKRDPSRMADSDRLPKHMAHLEKPPATEVPEEVFGRTQVSADMFSLFLHHNAARFYADVHTAALCTDWFSQADFFLSEWSAEGRMVPFAVSLCTRGLMWDLRRPPSGRGWLPLEKPQWGLTAAQVRKKLFEVKNAFRGCHSTGSELQLDLIPFLALLRAGDLSPSMRAMVDEIGILDVGATNRKKNEMLAERDWIDERVKNSVDFSGSSVEELPEFPDDDDDDDEMVIEEFDD